MADFTDALEKVVLGTPAQDHDDPGRARPDRATTSAVTPCSACSPRAPTRSGRSRSSRAGTRSASRSRARRPTSTLLGDVPARPDHRRARRAGRRGGRLRRRHHRRRVRPRPGQPDRPADGRPVGHVPTDRARSRYCRPRDRSSRSVRRLAGRPRRPGSWWTRRPAGSSTSATSGRCELLRDNRDRLDRLAEALLRARDAGRRGGVRGGRRAAYARPDFRRTADRRPAPRGARGRPPVGLRVARHRA